MALTDLTSWMDENTGPRFVWYVKRLSGNDTLANDTHQAGPYIPQKFLFDIFPSLGTPEIKNPRKQFSLYIDSHADVRPKAQAIWYNNKLFGGTRNETRITGFGGATSALLDPGSTGALAVFAFRKNENGEDAECHVWVCEHETEADQVEDRIGPVEPGKHRIWSVGEQGLFPSVLNRRINCWLEADKIPVAWLAKFPTGAEIIRKTVELRADHGLPVDARLLSRRDCEYEIFRSVEEATELPLIRQGFNTVDEFIARAQTILQRRKSRAGRSLELHLREIFREEGFAEGTNFSYQPESEQGKRPDFLFPSQAAYKDSAFPESRLRMLAVKTTCRERWTEVLGEAKRITQKHLLTVQEGVSESQFRQMTESGIKLVVPAKLVKDYPKTVQPHLQTLESFIGDVRPLVLR